MMDSFRTRMPALSDAELRQYIERHQDYKLEAVEFAVLELARRGQPISSPEWARMRSGLEQRDAALQPDPNPWLGGLLGATPAIRISRIRLGTAGLLASGLGCATALYLTAQAKAANPLGYDPLDTKKHLRELELFGGKANVLATEFRRWFDGLWHGRSLAYTVAWLTILAALLFWFVATHLSANLNPMPGDDQGGKGAGT